MAPTRPEHRDAGRASSRMRGVAGMVGPTIGVATDAYRVGVNEIVYGMTH